MEFKRVINAPEDAETINICLSKENTPIAWQHKVDELVECGMSVEDAEKVASEPICIELYYEKNYGLFAVETEAIDSTPIFSPYTKFEYEETPE